MAFIAFEGIDGSGKATQTELLAKALRAEGHDVDTHEFPAYKENIGGMLLGELLADPNSGFSSVHPKLGSLPYSIDRFQSSAKIREGLAAGHMVLADRFIGSNQIHQGGKFTSKSKRIKYLAWLDELEHELLNIPRPDLVIYLKAPVDVSLRLLAEKRKSKGGLLGDGEMDQVERDRKYLDDSHKMANWLATYYQNWRVIDCVDTEGKIRSREDIHDEILTGLRELISLSV